MQSEHNATRLKGFSWPASRRSAPGPAAKCHVFY